MTSGRTSLREEFRQAWRENKEPFLILGLGLVVGIGVIAFYLPILNRLKNVPQFEPVGSGQAPPDPVVSHSYPVLPYAVGLVAVIAVLALVIVGIRLYRAKQKD